jgi:integrase
VARGHVFERTTHGQTYYGYVLDLGDDPATGKRRQRREGRYLKKRQAEMAMHNAIVKLDEGRDVKRSRDTLRDYLEGWLRGVSVELRLTTARTYAWAIEKHVIPRIGGLKLQAVTADHLTQLYADLQAAGLGSVRYVADTLYTALAAAEDEGRIVKNPASKAKRPRKPDQREIDCWDGNETHRFLEATRDDPLYPAFVLTATTGMRRGEICGLR